jgi:DNA-binding SARP family transcriptional activator
MAAQRLCYNRAMPKLSLSLLGLFAASLDDRPLTNFRTKSVQALLIYLACEPRPHQRESLVGLFWPELPQASAQKRLRDSLYLLPRQFGAVAPTLR